MNTLIVEAGATEKILKSNVFEYVYPSIHTLIPEDPSSFGIWQYKIDFLDYSELCRIKRVLEKDGWVVAKNEHLVALAKILKEENTWGEIYQVGSDWSMSIGWGYDDEKDFFARDEMRMPYSRCYRSTGPSRASTISLYEKKILMVKKVS